MATENSKTTSSKNNPRREAMLRRIEGHQPVLAAVSKHLTTAIKSGQVTVIPAPSHLGGLRPKKA